VNRTPAANLNTLTTSSKPIVAPKIVAAKCSVASGIAVVPQVPAAARQERVPREQSLSVARRLDPAPCIDRRLENDGTVCDEFGVKFIHAVGVEVGEPAMRPNLGRRSGIRAFAEHDAHAVAPDQAPISGLRPFENEAKGFAIVLGTCVYVSRCS
jgi:hypothetical protein